MPEWKAEYYDHDWGLIETFDPIAPVVALKLKDPSTGTWGIPLGDTKLTRDLIGPKRTSVVLRRDQTNLLDGELREVNLSGSRDTLLCQHADFLQYLDERIYPFHYPFTFGDWPKKWIGKDLTVIVEDILDAMMDEDKNTPSFV